MSHPKLFLTPVPTQDIGLAGTTSRQGESKWGEHITAITMSDESDLADLHHQLDQHQQACAPNKAVYVLNGFEQFGPTANLGRGGPSQHSDQWSDFLRTIANYQVNSYSDGSALCVLGSVDYTDLCHVYDPLKQASQDTHYLQDVLDATAHIEARTQNILTACVAQKGLTLLLNGGHNLNRPLGRAVHQAYGPYISIQIDFHPDCRTLDAGTFHHGYHSGNHNTSLLQENCLKKGYFFYIDLKVSNSYCLTLLEDSRIEWEPYSYQQVGTYDHDVQHAFRSMIHTIHHQHPDVPVVLSICGDTIQPNNGLDSSAGKWHKGLTMNQVHDMVMYTANQLPLVAIQWAEHNKLLSHTPNDAIGVCQANLVGDLLLRQR